MRIIGAAVIGFFVWSIIWLGSEKTLSAVSPGWFGMHQKAFEAAVKNGEPFTADTSILLINIFRGSVISVISGYLTALMAGEKKRSPWILAVMLVAFGLLIVVLSWNYIPIWYHVLFTVLLIPMTLLGGKLYKKRQQIAAK